jgi:hypothetical protein
MYICDNISLKWEMFQRKHCREIKTQFCVLHFFLKIVLLWDNVEKCCRARERTDDNIMRHMFLACWITKATDRHSEYAIIIAFPWQQLLCERASMLRIFMRTWCFCLKNVSVSQARLASCYLSVYTKLLSYLNTLAHGFLNCGVLTTNICTGKRP